MSPLDWSIIADSMYNLRTRVRAAAVGAVRPPVEVRAQTLPTVAASQVTPTQALEILRDVSMVPETEVPFTESQLIEEAISPPVLDFAPDISFVSVRDTPVNLDESVYPLVPVAADSAAVQGPAVGTTPTRAPENVDMQNVGIEENSQNLIPLRVDHTKPQKPTLAVISNVYLISTDVTEDKRLVPLGVTALDYRARLHCSLACSTHSKPHIVNVSFSALRHSRCAAPRGAEMAVVSQPSATCSTSLLTASVPFQSPAPQSGTLSLISSGT